MSGAFVKQVVNFFTLGGFLCFDLTAFGGDLCSVNFGAVGGGFTIAGVFFVDLGKHSAGLIELILIKEGETLREQTGYLAFKRGFGGFLFIAKTQGFGALLVFIAFVDERPGLGLTSQSGAIVGLLRERGFVAFYGVFETAFSEALVGGGDEFIDFALEFVGFRLFRRRSALTLEFGFAIGFVLSGFGFGVIRLADV